MEVRDGTPLAQAQRIIIGAPQVVVIKIVIIVSVSALPPLTCSGC